jgi:hypothetical protein
MTTLTLADRQLETVERALGADRCDYRGDVPTTLGEDARNYDHAHGKCSLERSSEGMRFTLTIELGNEVMSSGADVAEALRHIATTLEAIDPEGTPEAMVGHMGAIADENDNPVGGWEITESGSEG